MPFNVTLIKQRLYCHDQINRSISGDYGLGNREFQDPEPFIEALLECLGQAPSDNPLCVEHSVNEVFEAAVRALASNSRQWIQFLRRQERLKEILCDYDACEFVSTINATDEHNVVEEIARLLGGQTERRDAKAIVKWARLLCACPDYYKNVIVALALDLCYEANEKCRRQPSAAELLPALVGALVSKTRRSRERYRRLQIPCACVGLPGMRYVLASEFLRNLGWNGFKPDRHVKRLIKRWHPGLAAEQPCYSALAGTGEREFREFVQYSLTGMALTPPGISYSHMDNLIWLLGAYVEGTGNETDTNYLLPD